MATPGFDSTSSTTCLFWHILKLPHFLQSVKLRYILSPDSAGVKVLENANTVFSLFLQMLLTIVVPVVCVSMYESSVYVPRMCVEVRGQLWQICSLLPL